MISSLIKRVSLVAVLSGLVFVAGAGADDINLPDMGSPADAILNNTEESRIGRMIMRDIRNSGQVVEDPLITEYLNDIGKVPLLTAEDERELSRIIEAGREALRAARAGELLAEELRLSQQALGSITGEFTPDDLLGRIFSEFCIGK